MTWAGAESALASAPARAPPTATTARAAIRLLLDDRRAQQRVDLPLQLGPPVVLAVDRPRQLDELRAEVAGVLAGPDLVLDPPQGLVDRTEGGGQGPQLLGVRDRAVPRRSGSGSGTGYTVDIVKLAHTAPVRTGSSTHTISPSDSSYSYNYDYTERTAFEDLPFIPAIGLRGEL